MSGAGMPMSAITRSPACASAGGNTSGIFGAASVTVIDASIAGRSSSARVGRQPGRQIDRDDRHAELVDVGHDRLEQPGQRPRKPGAESRVDDQIALGDFGEVQLPLLRVGDLDDGHADAAEHLEVDARVAAHLGDAAEQEDRSLDAALHQRARDHEAVAAVVAAAAQHADAAGRRASSNAASIAATAWRPAFSISTIDGNADVFDRAAIGLPHLLGVEHPPSVERTLVLDCVTPWSGAAQDRVGMRTARCGLRQRQHQAAAEHAIPVYDHGFLYGEGVYETLRTYNRVPFLYDRHMRRLRASAERLGSDVPFDDEERWRPGSTTRSRGRET